MLWVFLKSFIFDHEVWSSHFLVLHQSDDIFQDHWIFFFWNVFIFFNQLNGDQNVITSWWHEFFVPFFLVCLFYFLNCLFWVVFEYESFIRTEWGVDLIDLEGFCRFFLQISFINQLKPIFWQKHPFWWIIYNCTHWLCHFFKIELKLRIF